MIRRLSAELCLHGLEQVPVQNGGLLALQNFTFEEHLSDVETIAQQVRERSTRSAGGYRHNGRPERWPEADLAIFPGIWDALLPSATLECITIEHLTLALRTFVTAAIETERARPTANVDAAK
jgi:hypothetical protein